MVEIDSTLGQGLLKEGFSDVALLNAVQSQLHPAFCGHAASTIITRAVGRGVGDQLRFTEGFGSVGRPWPPVFAHFGWPGLDALPLSLKKALLTHLQYDGLPMSLLAEWFSAQGYVVDVVDGGSLTVERLRSDVAQAFSGVPGSRMYLFMNYSRTAMGQIVFSGGHYAPMAGFHRGADKVLLLEVNSWRYTSVWVSLPRLWSAVHTQVGNGAWRGYLRIRVPSAS